MTTCAKSDNINESASVCNLFLLVPNTDFREFLEEVDEFVKINLLFISRRAAESAERVRQIASKIFQHGGIFGAFSLQSLNP